MKNKNMNRRTFLKSTIGSGLGLLAAPYLVPSTVFGQTAPSEKITLGFVGMGKQGTYLLRAFLNEPNTQVLAVCDVDELKLNRAQRMTNEFYANQSGAGAYDGCDKYELFEDVVNRDDIDGVVIATPDHWHALVVVQSARAGKDIYCEKPLSQTIEESQIMTRVTREYNRVFQVGSMQRSYSQFRQACELVRNGYIGDVEHVTVDVGGPPRPSWELGAETEPDYLNWDLWAGPTMWRPYNSELSPHISKDIFPHWRWYRAYGGGMMTDWGAHHFDIAQWGLGMDDSGPVEIHPPAEEGYDVLTYKYANGVTMTRNSFEEGHGVLFEGTEGKIVVNRSYIKTFPESLQSVQLKPGDVHLYESKNHYADWLNSVRQRKKPICDVSVGKHSVIVCHLGNIAYRLNRSLYWDPNTERFQNDSDANEMLSRPYRSPWRL
ncbi:MAG: gfo/Idh/MocA family oxidoreductase [Candidatus Marinimicrobia bacterium]|nr:gfo/Idh/MocA family oxidoreductase [Candidatus Neomarinimicrobiota bacterium]